MLLAIAEILAFSHDAADQERLIAIRYALCDIEGRGCRLIGFHGEGSRLFIDYLLSLRIQKLHLCRSADQMVGGIHDTGADGGGISFANKARCIRLYHHILLGNGLVLEDGIIHLLVVSQSDETPGGDAFRQRKFQGNDSLCIRLHGRIEEGRLIQIFAKL